MARKLSSRSGVGQEPPRERKVLPKLFVARGADPLAQVAAVQSWLTQMSIALSTCGSAIYTLGEEWITAARWGHAAWALLTPAERALEMGTASSGGFGVAPPAAASRTEGYLRSALLEVVPDKVVQLVRWHVAYAPVQILCLVFRECLPATQEARSRAIKAIEQGGHCDMLSLSVMGSSPCGSGSML